MIGHARFHCWRDSERLMNPAKVVVHLMKGDRFKLYHYPITKVDAGCVSTEAEMSV
jgi:hypothetical protein